MKKGSGGGRPLTTGSISTDFSVVGAHKLFGVLIEVENAKTGYPQKEYSHKRDGGDANHLKKFDPVRWMLGVV